MFDYENIKFMDTVLIKTKYAAVLGAVYRCVKVREIANTDEKINNVEYVVAIGITENNVIQISSKDILSIEYVKLDSDTESEEQISDL